MQYSDTIFQIIVTAQQEDSVLPAMSAPGGGGKNFCGGVPPGSPNPDPQSDQKNVIFHTRFQT